MIDFKLPKTRPATSCVHDGARGRRRIPSRALAPYRRYMYRYSIYGYMYGYMYTLDVEYRGVAGGFNAFQPASPTPLDPDLFWI